jgi:hypothetical protein
MRNQSVRTGTVNPCGRASIAKESHHGKTCYISNELIDRQTITPLFRRVITKIDSSCVCGSCMYHDSYGHDECECEDSPTLSYQLMFVGILGSPVKTQPNDSVFTVKTFEGIARHDDLQCIIDDMGSNGQAVASEFSLFDSMDVYGLDTNKELVKQHVYRDTTPSGYKSSNGYRSTHNCYGDMNEIATEQSFKGLKSFDAYLCAFDIIVQKIAHSCASSEQGKTNPHMAVKKSKR